MATIPVLVCGDHWINPEQVHNLIIDNRDASHLVFEVNTEGPSLQALGIVDLIQQTLQTVAFDQSQVWIDRWHNAIEAVPFKRAFVPDMSHFFWMSDSYRHCSPAVLDPIANFGYFVGRATIPRAWMLYYLYQNYPTQFLFSLMTDSRLLNLAGPDNLDSWVPSLQREDFLNWWQHPPVTSITNHRIRDQYDAAHNTNGSLIEHYGKFYVELVCESYCRGTTFFPTEKTIRPLAMKKPVVMYGPSGFLSRLRDLGFKTWHQYWDESYDTLEGPARWAAMSVLIDQLTHLDWASVITDMEATLCHNREHLDHLIKKHKPG